MPHSLVAAQRWSLAQVSATHPDASSSGGSWVCPTTRFPGSARPQRRVVVTSGAWPVSRTQADCVGGARLPVRTRGAHREPDAVSRWRQGSSISPRRTASTTASVFELTSSLRYIARTWVRTVFTETPAMSPHWS